MQIVIVSTLKDQDLIRLVTKISKSVTHIQYMGDSKQLINDLEKIRLKSPKKTVTIIDLKESIILPERFKTFTVCREGESIKLK